MRIKHGRIKSALLLLAVMLFSVTAAAQTKTGQSNHLTNAEKKAGWKLLFDGQTLTGWRGFHNQQVPEGWGVADGCITKVKTGGTTKTGGDLITADQFENF